MDILVIGGGGREHAICDALRRSKRCDRLYCAPGNAGIASIATCVALSVMDFDGISDFARTNAIDLVFVAPDDPLAAGLVDRLTADGITAFGPSASAAIIEASKAFSKEFMKRHGIPTAAAEIFADYDSARAYLDSYTDYPVVLKADGLALGKGVIIAADHDEAITALTSMMVDKRFGNAARTVVIEEYLTGFEVSVLAFTDGETVRCMPAAQDHKKAFDGDLGENTGGMGAFAPTPRYTKELHEETLNRIILPTIRGLKAEGRTFRGVLYFGLMYTPRGMKVIEYNARFGDPETQAVLPLLQSDFLDIVCSVLDGSLDTVDIRWSEQTGFTVVAASAGYPGAVTKGYPITIGELPEDITVYHSGTALRDGVLVTNGGRVLCVTTTAQDIPTARAKVYAVIDRIQFSGMRYRHDIGVK